jgi:DNA ligase-1
MNRFAALVDALAREPEPRHKQRLLLRYFQTAPAADRAAGLALLRGDASPPRLPRGALRQLADGLPDASLFELSRGLVGDFAETVALSWPTRGKGHNNPPSPSLADVLGVLRATRPEGRVEAAARLLDELDAAGRLALLKILSGGLRAAACSRDLRAAVAMLGSGPPERIAEAWLDFEPPYEGLFAWAEGRVAAPATRGPASYYAPLEPAEWPAVGAPPLVPDDGFVTWLWRGEQMVLASAGAGQARLFTAEGEAVAPRGFEALAALDLPRGVFHGVWRGDDATPRFDVLDLLVRQDADMRDACFALRRDALVAALSEIPGGVIGPARPLRFQSFAELDALRRDPPPGADGVAIFDRAGARGRVWIWKRPPFEIDAVLMTVERALRGLVCAFGLWRGDELVPVGRASLDGADGAAIAEWALANEAARFGHVREVVHTARRGLVLRVLHEGFDRAPRRKAGVVARAARLAGARWGVAPALAPALADALAEALGA